MELTRLEGQLVETQRILDELQRVIDGARRFQVSRPGDEGDGAPARRVRAAARRRRAFLRQ